MKPRHGIGVQGLVTDNVTLMKQELPIRIPKERLAAIKLRRSEKKDALSFQERIRQDLDSALIFGKTFNQNVRIVFNSSMGPCELEASIWTTTEKNIILQGGSTLPFDCVEELEI